jgi:signal transduction histidine kinase
VTLSALANRRAGYGQLIVQDNGVGMSADVLERIGQPWNQVSDASASKSQRSRGSGLGLALVKRLAELQGGSLHVTSHLGAGTQAVITLPLANPMPPA